VERIDTVSLTAQDEHGARVALAGGPRVPVDIDLFSSNTLFGQPGIYPDGRPMVPAAGNLDAETARELALAAGGTVARDAFDTEPLLGAVPEPGVRAGLALLSATMAAPLLGDLSGLTLPRTYGDLDAPGRVIGNDENGVRVVNARYSGEHPALLALSLTHDLLWSGEGAAHDEEATLHALGAMVHLQLIARHPAIAHTGTELARRQNSLAVTLLESRRHHDAAFRAREPEGAGTIPGGAPALASADFWSIPFAPPVTEPAAAPPALRAVLAYAGIIGADERVDAYDASVGDVLASDRGSWLSLTEHVRVAVTLGTLTVDELASAVQRSVEDTVSRFQLHDALPPRGS